MPKFRSEKASLSAALTGATVAIMMAFALPASAVPVFSLDTDNAQTLGGVTYTYEIGLNYSGASIHDGDAIAAEANGADRIGWFGAPNGAFHEDFPFTVQVDGVTLSPGDAIDLSLANGNITGATVFTWELVERADIWDVVKLGVKVGELAGYFVVDAGGADVGTFTLDLLFAAAGGESGDLASWHSCNNGGQCSYQGINHLSFFGETAAVPEPATLALVGLGLLGVGAIRRRKVT